MVGHPERLSEAALERIHDPSVELLLSAASTWEIAIKAAIGKLDLPGDPSDVIPGWMVRTGVVGLPVHHRHAAGVFRLPRLHSDPFDRLLIAQAFLEEAPVLTADPVFEAYGVSVIRGSDG